MIKTDFADFFFVDKCRATLAIEGEDKIDFLQALTTNNIEKVSKEGIVYTAILSPQGKYLFDFFVFKIRLQIWWNFRTYVFDSFAFYMMLQIWRKLRTKLVESIALYMSLNIRRKIGTKVM